MADITINREANAKRIAEIESCFGSSGQPLSAPGRLLVGEGILTKMCRKKPKRRQFFLFTDTLVYCNIIIHEKKYNKQRIIPLDQVQLESLEDEDDQVLKNGWIIKTPSKSFEVYGDTPTEKENWMTRIQKCISDLLLESGKKPAEEYAAVWVPDSKAQVCQVCANQFTFINRRHHCRNCGSVTCGQCSKHQALLPNQGKKPLRVCNSCHSGISEKGQDDNQTTGSAPNDGDDSDGWE